MKKCEESDILHVTDEHYAKKFIKEIEVTGGLALCPDFNHVNYQNAGWKNH